MEFTQASATNSTLMATDTSTSILNQKRRRKKTSWTEQHIIVIKKANLFQRRCAYCHIIWSSSTSTGSIAKHLSDKHQVNSASQPHNSSVLVQSSLDSSKLAISRTLERKFDSSVARYIVTEMLSHVHIESQGFKQLMEDLSPGYRLKSACTLKTLILRMYILLHQLVIKYLSTQNFRVSITYDGWTNNSLKGF